MLYKYFKYYDVNCTIFFLFSITYTLLIYYNGYSPSNFESLTYLLCPCAFFLFGKHIAKMCDENEIKTFWLITIFSSTIILIISNLIDAYVNGIVNDSRNVLINQNLVRGATIQGIIISIGLSGIAYLFSYRLKNFLQALMYSSIVLLSLFCTIHLVNRTGLYISILTIIALYLYYSRKGISSLVLPFLLIMLFYYLLLEYNIFSQDVISAYDSREIDADYSSMTAGNRTIIWSKNIGYLLNYPLGWRRYIVRSGFAHNLWLDVARESGWIPFSMLSFITIRFIHQSKILYDKPVSRLNGFILGIIVCFLIQCFVEPIIEAQSTFFYLLCMLWGMQQVILIKYNSPLKYT